MLESIRCRDEIGMKSLMLRLGICVSMVLLVGCASQEMRDSSVLECVEHPVKSASRDVYGDTLDGELGVGASIPVYAYNLATGELTRASYDMLPIFKDGRLVALCGASIGKDGLYTNGRLSFRAEAVFLERYLSPSGQYAFLRVGTGFSSSPQESIEDLVGSEGYVGYEIPDSEQCNLSDLSAEVPLPPSAMFAVSEAGYSESKELLLFEPFRWWL